MGRPLKADSGFSPKSSPTTATRFTGAKNDAATAKNDALPPRTFSARPNGVSTVSYATLPTTRMDMSQSLPVGPHVPADDGGQVALELGRHQLRRRDQGVRQRVRAFAPALGTRHAPHRRPQDGLRGGGVGDQVPDDLVGGDGVVVAMPAAVVGARGHGRRNVRSTN